MKHVTSIQVGVTPDGYIALILAHDDSTTYSTKLSRKVAAEVVDVLEQAHGMALAFAKSAPSGHRDGVRIRDDAQLRIE